MQTTPVMAALPQSTGNVAQRADAGGEVAEVVDFSALLMAQIKGGRVAGVAELAEEDVPLDSGAAKSGKPPLPEDARQEIVSFSAATDPVITNSQNLQAVIIMPVPIAVDPQLMASAQGAVSGKVTEAPGRVSKAPGQFEKGIPAAQITEAQIPAAQIPSPNTDRQAGFAADGKFLPQAAMGKAEQSLDPLAKTGEALVRSVLPQETRSFSDVQANTLPVVMTASHTPVVETRPPVLPTSTLQAPVGSTGWGESLGQKVIWMAGQQTQVAELHLNPPNLGPMEVRLSISNDQISALFVSHQPAVREAIEAAMPRLREMLAEGGMTLGNASVSSDSLPQQQSSGREGQSGASRQSDFPDMGNLRSTHGAGGIISLRHDGSGVVDLFA
ncbi:MAG: flagellar hook-length control protein FliK [Sulfuricella denitrificans]|nr:flagellar hook-length control protein FliK [Sulfuricella denitrificans]